jgi:hypothetical protein
MRGEAPSRVTKNIFCSPPKIHQIKLKNFRYVKNKPSTWVPFSVNCKNQNEFKLQLDKLKIEFLIN